MPYPIYNIFEADLTFQCTVRFHSFKHLSPSLSSVPVLRPPSPSPLVRIKEEKKDKFNIYGSLIFYHYYSPYHYYFLRNPSFSTKSQNFYDTVVFKAFLGPTSDHDSLKFASAMLFTG
jgi:hypothetical protein